jgi:succinoglycan biosynthesis transport protein ExoP
MFDPKQLSLGVAAPSQVAVPATPPVQSLQPTHLLDRLSVLFTHRRLVFAVFAVTVAVMMAQTYSAIPMYRAKAQILIQDERATQVANLNSGDPSYWQDPEPYYNTQYRILQSRGLARRVVERLKLASVPEFNGTQQDPGGPLALVRQVRGRIVAAGKAAWSVLAGGQQPVAAEVPAADESEQEAALIGAFLSRVRVEPVRQTRLVDVYFESADPVFAATAVNVLAEEYVEQNLQIRLGNIQKTLAWLETELQRQQAKMTHSENALAEYRNQQNALSLEEGQNIVVARLNQLNDAVTKARTNRVQKESLYAQVRGVDPKSAEIDSFPAVAQSPAVIEAKQRITQLDADRAKLSARYGPQHPEMQKLATQLENARRQLGVEAAKVVEQLRSDYLAALAEERSLSASL